MTYLTLLTSLLVAVAALTAIRVAVVILGRRGTRIVVNKTSSSTAKDDAA